MIKELDGGIKGAIKRALKYGNMQYKIPCAVFDKMGYSNHELQDLEVRNKVYHYLKKNYSRFLDSRNYELNNDGVESNEVWICWLQGIENAPEIVRVCYSSIKKWMPDKEIHIIDNNNLYKYINLPDYVIKKWKCGIISNTLFSDFIRLSVLTQFGGIWIDATVFMTGRLPKYIVDSDFFVYRTNKYDTTKVGESWFIKSNAHNRILQVTLDLMNEYWRRENKIRDYFIMFIFMKMAKDKYPQDFERMIIIPSSIPHMMQGYLNKPFDANIYTHICKITNIHKLTYKDVNTAENTFSSYIIKKGMECV